VSLFRGSSLIGCIASIGLICFLGLGAAAGTAGAAVAAAKPPSPASTLLGPLAGILGSLSGIHRLPSTAWPGYSLSSSTGAVGTYGGVPFEGSLHGVDLSAPVVAMAATPDGRGYWLAAADGGVFSFGDAPFYGSAGGKALDQPVVAMVPAPDGRGYWLAAADGGVFSFGDAPFEGSLEGVSLSAPVVAMAATPDGRGYWLVAADGGVFAFGDAPFYGSVGGRALDQPVVAMAATPDGHGYWLVAADGGVFAFGDAPFYGSVGGKTLDQRVVAMAAAPDGHGYWLVAADGGVFSFGDAPFRGSASGYVPAGQSITAIVSDPGTSATSQLAGDFTAPATSVPLPYPAGAAGFDISFPQCGKTYPARSAVAVVGVNHGSAFTINPCFSREASWAGSHLTAYLNLNSPTAAEAATGDRGPDGTCAGGDPDCQSYNFGFNAAQWSMSAVHAAGFSPHTWWLDIETSNVWSTDTGANDEVIAGALAAIRLAGDQAAIYSTDYQWGQIAGQYVPGVPAWYATGVATFTPQAWCSATSFAGGPVALVQGRAGSYDGAYAC
jgi:hypothetical protein